MAQTELETRLLALSPVEQANAIQILTQTLSQQPSGISKTSGVCGGDVCITNTRIPVWLLISLHRQGSTDAELLTFYPHLNAVDLVNAWAYAKAHLEEIDAAITEEESVMTSKIE